VKKVPVYIVTKDKPKVMHASHIEDDIEDVPHKKITRIRTNPDHEVLIRGIYKGDESHVHEDIEYSNVEFTTLQPEINTNALNKHIQPYILKTSNLKPNNYLLYHNMNVRHNRLRQYDE